VRENTFIQVVKNKATRYKVYWQRKCTLCCTTWQINVRGLWEKDSNSWRNNFKI